MPRRKDPFGVPDMKPDIKQKFQQLVSKGKKGKKERSWIHPKWQLWRWDNLQDVPQE